MKVETDYTEIADDEIRTKICDLMSEMLDNPDEHGIYPTSKFMWKMEQYILAKIKTLEAENKKLNERIKSYITFESGGTRFGGVND